MNNKEQYIWIFYIVFGFLCGSTMFSQIIPKYIFNKDICKISKDHNPGATNVFIECGIGCGLLCLILDIVKGFFPIFFSTHRVDINNLLFTFVLIAPVLGHAIAPFNNFQGGKCIATAFGVTLALFNKSKIVLLLATLYILFSTILKIHSHTVRSIVTFGLFGILSAIFLIRRNLYSVAFGCVLISIIVILKHIGNYINITVLQNIYHNKFSFKKSD